jgi:hypothetical protein
VAVKRCSVSLVGRSTPGGFEDLFQGREIVVHARERNRFDVEVEVVDVDHETGRSSTSILIRAATTGSFATAWWTLTFSPL